MHKNTPRFSLILTAFALLFSLCACSNNLRKKGKRYDEKRANEKIEQPSTPIPGGNAGNSTASPGGADSSASGTSGSDSSGAGTNTGGTK